MDLENIRSLRKAKFAIDKQWYLQLKQHKKMKFVNPHAEVVPTDSLANDRVTLYFKKNMVRIDNDARPSSYRGSELRNKTTSEHDGFHRVSQS